VEDVVEERPRAREGDPRDHRVDQQRAAHDEREARIPVAGDVEEADHLGGPGHAAEAEAEREQQTRGERDQAPHDPSP